jgi:hypothetical protein
MVEKSEELKKALELIHEELFYVVQERLVGEIAWRTKRVLNPDTGDLEDLMIRGKKKTYEVRNRLAEQHRKLKFRVVTKAQADMYSSGINDARSVPHSSRKERSPLMYMPDNI